MDILENRDQWQAEFEQGWLRNFRENNGAMDWTIYNKPQNSTAPSGSGVDLSRSRLVLISSAGSYLYATQAPYDMDDLGDYTTRIIPADTPPDAITFAHGHYDEQFVMADQQVLLPLAHLRDMVDEGIIGELAPDVISFMGYQPDVIRMLDETTPAIVAAAKKLGADAALLVPA